MEPIDIEPGDTFYKRTSTIWQARRSNERTVYLSGKADRWGLRAIAGAEVAIPHANALRAFDALGIPYKLVTPEPEYPRVPFPTHALREIGTNKISCAGPLESVKEWHGKYSDRQEIVAIDPPKP